MRKSITIILIIILVFTQFAMSFANNSTQIEKISFITDSIDNEFDLYAKESIRKHLTIASENGYFSSLSFDLSPGLTPFIFDESSKYAKSETVYYLLCEDYNVIGYLAVSRTIDGSLTSTFKFLNSTESNYNLTSSEYPYALVIYQDSLLLFNGSSIIAEIESITNIMKDKQFTRINDSFLDYLSKQKVLSTYNESNKFESLDFIVTASSNYLNVPIVGQGNDPICWAASMASIIKYKTGISYSALQVANDTNHGPYGATPTDVKNYYYKNYAMNSTKTNYLNSSTVFSEINSNDPMQVFHYSAAGNGHSLVLRGYYQFVGGECYYYYMDSASAQYTSVSVPISAQNNGSLVGYNFGGTLYYWTYTVYNIQ